MSERRILLEITLEFSIEKDVYIETHYYSDGNHLLRQIDPRNRDEIELVRRRVDTLQRNGHLRSMSPRQVFIMEIENYPTDSMEEQDFLDNIVFNLRSGG